MTTTRTFTATCAQELALSMPIGSVYAHVDPAADAITVVLSTPDDDGPAANAVRGSTGWENHTHLTIDVPKPASVSVTLGNSTFNFSGGIDGQLGDTRLPHVGPITATVTLPPTALGIAMRSLSADLTVTGHLPTLAFSSTSGDLYARSVKVLSATTVSGDVDVVRIGGDAHIRTTSGRVRIGVHEGHNADILTVSGDIRLTASADATGSISARTVSGDTELHGTGHLDVQTRTVSGRARRH